MWSRRPRLLKNSRGRLFPLLCHFPVIPTCRLAYRINKAGFYINPAFLEKTYTGLEEEPGAHGPGSPPQ